MSRGSAWYGEKLFFDPHSLEPVKIDASKAGATTLISKISVDDSTSAGSSGS